MKFSKKVEISSEQIDNLYTFDKHLGNILIKSSFECLCALFEQ